MKRRQFIKSSALASTALLVPHFLKGFENSAFFRKNTSGKTLVVIQLSGGNDGLNTIVPFRNDHYYQLRPNLAIAQNEVLKLHDELGFNPAMESLRSLYDEGLMSIVNSVGYPNPNRSHFRSMDIWQTASAADDYLQTGWLGRYLDAQCSTNCAMHKAIEVDGTLSLAMKGENAKGMAVTNARSLHKITSHDFFKKVANNPPKGYETQATANVDFLYKTMIETVSSADYIFEKSKIHRSTGDYPANPLARKLKNIAELIIADIDTSVFYVTLGGFDTHVNQPNQHGRLLKNYSESVAAFVRDLQAYGKLDDTLILTFSEFGRRVAQNASNGTDHGTANNLFLMSGKLTKPGFYNGAPNLTDLDNGDLKYQVDFRNVYADVLANWLEVDVTSVLGGGFRGLGVV